MNNIKEIEAIAQTIRALTIDSIQKSNSGHPGLPMGCAEIGAVLFGNVIKVNPDNSNWINRDRFVLSAGHGSMLLYSLLHISGYNLGIDDIKEFRKIGSKTPGHPEYGHTDGVEATTGPLGAGFSNAVGMAIAESMLADKFNTPEHKVIDHFTYVLAGDGCLMEGVSYEAASLAGHLGLGKLILLYDSNSITIEGSTSLSTSENVIERFKSFGWHTETGDGNNIEEILNLISKAKHERNKPTIIELKTTIGYGSPNKSGTSGIHGAPLGPDEIKLTRINLGIPDQDFYINQIAIDYFKVKKIKWNDNYNNWLENFKSWSKKNTDLKKEWDHFFSSEYKFDDIQFPKYKVTQKIPTRKTGGEVLNSIAEAFSFIIGGSADLSPSTNTRLVDMGDYSFEDNSGRNIHFGIREHAMGGITNGIQLYGGFRPFCSTFLVFSDYMKPALRLAALMGIGSIFVFTHDSIFVGEDGPTHQPVEQLESLRGIPNLSVLRPADGDETIEAWKFALKNTNSPTAIILSRQPLEVFEKRYSNWQRDYEAGAYIVKDSVSKPDIVILATGSEVNMALEVAQRSDKNIRIVSISSRKRFTKLPPTQREKIVPGGTRIITLEAGITYGWEGLATTREDAIGINEFGFSGNADDVAQKLDFNVQMVLNRLNYS